MKESSSSNKEAGNAVKIVGGIDKSKRRLTKTGLIGAPLLMTIANKPAWAQYCNTDSGRMSGNLSASGGVECVVGGEGCSGNFYRANSGLWHPVYAPGTLFNSAFGCVAFENNPTLMEVLDGRCTMNYEANVFNNCLSCGTDMQIQEYQNAVLNCAFQAVAALQNAFSPDVNYLYSVDGVLAMFCDAYNSRNIATINNTHSLFFNQNNNGCPGREAPGQASPMCM